MLEIKGITNSGRNVTIIPRGIDCGRYQVTLYIDGLDGPSNPWTMDEGYIHLTKDEHTPEQIEAITELNIYYFAEAVAVKTSTHEIEHNIYITGRKPFRNILKQFWRNVKAVFYTESIFANLFEEDVPENGHWGFNPDALRRIMDISWYDRRDVREIVPLTNLHLGGTWQKYYKDRDWLDKAEQIKGRTIYLAS